MRPTYSSTYTVFSYYDFTFYRQRQGHAAIASKTNVIFRFLLYFFKYFTNVLIVHEQIQDTCGQPSVDVIMVDYSEIPI